MTATPWVQVGVCVAQLVTSVHVNPITLVQSVISVPQDILVFQTVAVSIDSLADIGVCIVGVYFYKSCKTVVNLLKWMSKDVL